MKWLMFTDSDRKWKYLVIMRNVTFKVVVKMQNEFYLSLGTETRPTITKEVLEFSFKKSSVKQYK